MSLRADDPGGILRELELFVCIIGWNRRARRENLLLFPLLVQELWTRWRQMYFDRVEIDFSLRGYEMRGVSMPGAFWPGCLIP